MISLQKFPPALRWLALSCRILPAGTGNLVFVFGNSSNTGILVKTDQKEAGNIFSSIAELFQNAKFKILFSLCEVKQKERKILLPSGQF